MTIAKAPPRTESVSVAGCSIQCRTWGQSSPARPDIVLLHGGAAHARWWDHLAPALGVNRTVVALDLSGHGESGWRSAYSLDGWGREVVDIASQLRLNRPVVVGHSLGGIVALTAAARAAELFARVIVIDSALQMMDQRSETLSRRAARDSPVFPSREIAIERFRLVPDADAEPDLLR